jgi:integrase
LKVQQQVKQVITQPLIDEFIDKHDDTVNTKKAYKTHMNKFKEFLNKERIVFDKKYTTKLMKNVRDVSKSPNPYDLVKSYYEFLKKEYDYLNPDYKDAHCYTVVALFYDNGIIINTHFLKSYMATVREKGTSGDSGDSKTKEEIITFINNCNDSRLRLWVLFLASTGFRPIEPLTLRWCDIMEPTKEVTQPRVFLRDSKTDRKRIRYITQELFKQLQLYKKEKYAPKHTTILEKSNGKRKRFFGNWLTYDPNQLIFSIENDSYRIKEQIKGKKDKKTLEGNKIIREENKKVRKEIAHKAHNIYRFLWWEFDDVRKKLEITEINEDNGRNEFTPNSFRHYVRTYVSRKVTRDFSEWFIGHYVSAYDDIRHNKGLSTLDDYRLVEKEFTFLDVNVMDEITKAERERIQSLEMTVKQQAEQMAEMQEKFKQQRKDFLIDKFEQKLEDLHKEYVNEYIIQGKLKPIPSGIPKEKLNKWVKDTNVKLEELAIITPQEVIEALEPINEDDRKILNEYIEENKPYVVLDLPNIAISEKGK